MKRAGGVTGWKSECAGRWTTAEAVAYERARALKRPGRRGLLAAVSSDDASVHGVAWWGVGLSPRVERGCGAAAAEPVEVSTRGRRHRMGRRCRGVAHSTVPGARAGRLLRPCRGGMLEGYFPRVALAAAGGFAPPVATGRRPFGAWEFGSGASGLMCPSDVAIGLDADVLRGRVGAKFPTVRWNGGYEC